MDESFWEDFIAASSRQWGNIAGAVLTKQPYYSPDDPRFGSETISISRPVANYDPNRPLTPPMGFPNAGGLVAANVNKQGLGVNIPTWAIAGGLAFLGVYMLGGRRR